MSTVQLNLARKWRAQVFDNIIGQDLSVKMLKNSIYRAHFFPVYLFWGQRGTGKTSMARVFATAINCQALELFQKDPKNVCVPCRTCNSCVAMYEGKHPDFAEIDAASHTGVDNVRNIIDSASFLPLMGSKKIYLIDEAHMLSKAAFNALLKILEEPPATALFILATTDHQKIIDTVRSRCFQVCFKSVDTATIVDHLYEICSKESIYADKDALMLIAHESEGSVRDALNILERIRFAQGRITRDTVLAVLGHLDDVTLMSLVDAIIEHNTQHCMNIIHTIAYDTLDADYMYKRLVELVRAMVWSWHGLDLPIESSADKIIQQCAKKCRITRMIAMLELLYDQEKLFTKTANKHTLLEIIILKMCYEKGQINDKNTSGVVAKQPIPQLVPDMSCQSLSNILPKNDVAAIQKKIDALEKIECPAQQNWGKFIEKIMSIEEPLVQSIFSHAEFRDFDVNTGVLNVAFARQFVFFQEWLVNNTSCWKPLLDELFSCDVTFNPHFTSDVEPIITNVQTTVPCPNTPSRGLNAEHHDPKKASSPGYYRRKTTNYQEVPKRPIVDVSDESKWPNAAMILRYFPGTIRKS